MIIRAGNVNVVGVEDHMMGDIKVVVVDWC